MQRLDEEKRRLAEEALSRAASITKRYERIFPEYADDFESSALWGVVRAASEYQPDKGETWKRWSKMCIRAEIKEFLRSAHVRHGRTSWCRESLDDISSRKNNISEYEGKEEIEHMLEILPSKYTILMRLIYVEGMFPAEAGRAIGVTDKQGCRLHKKAIEFLKRRVA